jgi:hypothetical protein
MIRRLAWFLWMLGNPRRVASHRQGATIRRPGGSLGEPVDLYDRFVTRAASLAGHVCAAWFASKSAEAIVDRLLTLHEEGTIARAGYSRAHRPRWPWGWRKRR